MHTLTRLLLLSLTITVLTACGGGTTNTDVPTDTSLAFSSFPPGYFDGNYTSSHTLSGSDTNGNTYTATASVQSGTDTTYDFQSVKTMEVLVLVTQTNTNAVSGTTGYSYYTTDPNNRKKVGSYTPFTDVSSTATSNFAIPLTATIGQFGTVGNYTLSDGTKTNATWSLKDGFNGKALLVETIIENDSSNQLYSTIVGKSLINQDGSIVSLALIITLHQSNNFTITLSGS